MNAVLLLNVTYAPIGFLSLEEAVGLMLRDKVEAVEGLAKSLKTVSGSFDVPAVLRLRYFVNVPHREKRWTKRNVLERDGYACGYCGVKHGQQDRRGHWLSKNDFTVDHIKPQVQGGKSTWSNTIAACPDCNHRKGGRTPNQAGMKLLWEPKRPRTNYIVASGDVPSAWKNYIEVKK